MAKVKTKIDDGFNPELVETAFFDGELEIPIVKDTNPPLPTKVIPFTLSLYLDKLSTSKNILYF